MLASCVMSAQENNSRLNVKYLKLIENDTEASRARRTDRNGDKCALIKIQTPNMGMTERNSLEFSADLGTETHKVEGVGEVKLFLTEGCRTLIIMHPEYGKLIYLMPIRVEGFKTYEMVLEAKKDGFVPGVVINSNYVLIKVTPSDALISIDGNFYPDGSAYISVDEPHDLVVSRSLYHDYEKTIYASPNETMTYEVKLAPAYGWLLIGSSPESDATILINGVRKGVTPYKSDTLASGEYEVTLMREMYENVTKTVRVFDGNESEISIPMKPNFANVTISTDVESDIYIDGKMKDRGSWTGRLLQGSHKAEARKASHRTTAMALEITAGKDESVKLDAPTPIYGAINVTSSPVEAQVYLDGAEIGKTPFVNNRILIGSHELRFVKQGCAPLAKTITVEEGKMTTVSEKLVSNGMPKQEPEVKPEAKTEKDVKPVVFDKMTFVTLNAGMSTHGDLSYGLTFGQVKRFGWFASVMTNFNFKGFKKDYECDSDMMVDGNYPFYTGKQSFTTLSVTGGFMMKVAKPVAIKIGVGYGVRNLVYETVDGKWVRNKAESIQGLDVNLGTQLNFGRFVISLDCVTASFKEFEAKIGLGYGI